MDMSPSYIGKESVMRWRVDFYSDRVMEEIEAWPTRMWAKFAKVVELIEKVGPEDIGMPHIKPLGQGLFEIRVKTDEGLGRAPFCLRSGKVVIVLSSFIKKTQKAPLREIELARKRMKEVTNAR